MANDKITDSISDSDGPLIDDNVIRIQLRKPQHRKWELRTRNCSPGIRFPTIQLFDCDGNLLVETNNDNVDIKSSDVDAHMRSGRSLNEADYRENIKRHDVRKNNTVSGDRGLYTRYFKNNNGDNVMKMCISNNYVINDTYTPVKYCEEENQNIPEKNDALLNISTYHGERRNSDESTIMSTLGMSENDNSSYKSSDDESSSSGSDYTYITGKAGTLLLSKEPLPPTRRRRPAIEQNVQGDYVENWIDKNAQSNCDMTSKRRGQLRHYGNENPNVKCSISEKEHGIQKSKSFSKQNDRVSRDKIPRRSYTDVLVRPDLNVTYASPSRKVSFLDTYLKSLPTRNKPEIDWRSPASGICALQCVKLRDRPKEPANKTWRHCHIWEDKTDGVPRNATFNSEADAEFKKRLQFYRRGNSSSDYWYWKRVQNAPRTRRRSEGDGAVRSGSSCSESVDEADKVLDRLRRRIIQNKLRVKHEKNCACRQGGLPCSLSPQSRGTSESRHPPRGPDAAPLSMGSNVSQHSGKGLTGRRARSSGDLCNGESKIATETAVYGSVIGDSMGWNRSLPNHLDAHRPEGPGVASNNNYGEVGSYRTQRRCGRTKGTAYRIYRAGSELEPVWKLQDPACDQGYGSERSPEEDLPPPAALGQLGPLDAMEPRATLDYEAQLRAMYPFIDSENSFEVVVEKDGRGLGMSVGAAGGAAAGLVRIRRLYAPQPAWSTGQLQAGDLLLAANRQPLAGLSSHEALDVLRTTPSTVRLLVCRPSADVLERLTPPGEPPAPPARFPPPDPLNCHPLHTRLSHTTSNTTTSSSEGGGGVAVSRSGSKSARSGASAGGGSPECLRRSGLRLPLPPSPLPLPLPIQDVQYGDDGSMEFDIVMNKVNGSLGFTLRKEDHSVLGHYVRALVREPALSDTRIHPGDRIVAVNDIPMSNLSHPEAVAFLRQCGEEVKLRLYRDHAATPLTAISPTECDSSLRPKPHLRQEAVNMLCDLAARRLSPDTEAGMPRAPCLSPRKLRKLTRDSTGFSHTSNGNLSQPYSVNCPTSTETYSNSDNELSHAQSYHSNDTVTQRLRPDYLPLALPADTTTSAQRMSHLTAAHGYELNNLDNDVLDAPHVYRDSMLVQEESGGEPMSMPAELTCAEDLRHFRRSPAYQSAAVHPTSDQGQKDTGTGLKKWKGVQMSPESSPRACTRLQKENRVPSSAPTPVTADDPQPTILTVELNRGWNSRLGFSVQSHSDTNQSYISAIYSDSVAAKDGRLQKGDIILQVNDENVSEMKTNEVIDLLRILRGAICITVLRPPHTK